MFTATAPDSPEVTRKHVWNPFNKTIQRKDRGKKRVGFESRLLMADSLRELYCFYSAASHCVGLFFYMSVAMFCLAWCPL